MPKVVVEITESEESKEKSRVEINIIGIKKEKNEDVKNTSIAVYNEVCKAIKNMNKI